MSQFLDKLSEVQREAAQNFDGPALIVAGAGSGKTRVLTYRIAYMLERGINPYNILALTFTNKAAKEMRERIAAIISPERARSLWMGTFHSVFARILRREAEKLGYPPTFTIYDTTDSRNVVKSVLRDMNLDEDTYKPAEVFSRISLAKNNLLTPDAYQSNSTLTAEDRERRRPQFVEVYRRYMQKCREYGAMDFDDLLLNMNFLLRDHPDVLKHYQELFRYVMVDEYQDTNTAQYLIVKRIVEAHRNICVVGDDAQSIYSFRGAKIENILRFQQDYPEAQIYKLEQNYRSTQTIVEAANSIIEKNRRQIRKKLFSANEQGEKIKVFRAYTDKEEAVMVVSDIYTLIRARHVDPDRIAVLYRTNAQSRTIEDALRMRNIPYRIYGGQSFYQRKEVKDVLAYIRLAVNHRDDEALRRIINYPARGIGDVTIEKVARTAANHNVSMWDVISKLTPEQMELRGAAGKKIQEFKAMIEEFSSMVYTTPAYEMGLHIATRSGIAGHFRMQQTPEAMSVLDNINELLNSIASFVEARREEDPAGEEPATIDLWLQNVSLLTDMDNEKEGERNHVTLMTIHSAKGLEFEYVYIVGLEENLFPSQMCADSPEGLEEERRLFYVALTRARNVAVLTFSGTRYRWGEMTSNRPSRFLRDIDPACLDMQFASEDDAPEDDNREGIKKAFRRYETRREQTAYPAGTASSPRPASSPRSASIPGSNMRSMGRRPAESVAAGGTSTAASAGIPASASDLSPGNRVEHEKFGRGTVTSVETTSNGAKATIDFDSAGPKTLLLKYAKLNLMISD